MRTFINICPQVGKRKQLLSSMQAQLYVQLHRAQSICMYNWRQSPPLIVLYLMLPYTASPTSTSSLFDAILEECSMEQHPPSQHLSLDDFQDPHPSTPPRKEQQPTWVMLAEPDLQDMFSQDHSQAASEALVPEFETIRSVRLDQESKVQEFLSKNRVKLTARLKNSKGEGSQTWKHSNSLSPRKTKRIEKVRPFALTPLDQ